MTTKRQAQMRVYRCVVRAALFTKGDSTKDRRHRGDPMLKPFTQLTDQDAGFLYLEMPETP